MSVAVPSPTSASWLERRHRPAGAPPRVALYCFPFAGGSAAYYHAWAEEFRSDVELVPVQLPGRGTLMAEGPVRSMAVAADLAAAAIARSPVPAALFGHSMGAVLAFETARRLERRGHPVEHLFVSGRPCPTVVRPPSPVSGLPRERFVDMLRDYGAAPEEVLSHDELLDVLLPMIRADFHLIENYRYEPEIGSPPPLACPVSAWCGDRDPEVPPELMARWGLETSGPFTLEVLSGGHFFLTDHRSRIVSAVHELLQGVGR